MKTLIFLLFWIPMAAFADGLPYNINGELSREWIILHMNDAQFKEVDTLRTVTLTKAQRTLLSRLYKIVPERIRVMSSSFNDNREGESKGAVHCVWLRDRSLGITYDAAFAIREPELFWEGSCFYSADEPDMASRFIMTHDAKVYLDGKLFTNADVFSFIDEAAKKPGLVAGQAVDTLAFSLPPLYLHAGYHSEKTSPSELLQAFTVYGATKNVAVQQTW